MKLPRMGQGTWKLGDFSKNRNQEIESIRTGIENGLYLIDTAEMYGEGRSEKIVGEAIKPYDRKNLYIVSKVYPFNAGKDIYNSLEKSLLRLGTDYLDLYLLHWRGSIPLSETIYHMENMVSKGLIKAWGVSNFDTGDMKDLLNEKNGENCAVNQVLYNLGSRGIEYSLIPFLKENNIDIMAYCPIVPDNRMYNNIAKNEMVKEISKRNNISIPQLLLSFILFRNDIIPIPRSSNQKHNLENAKMLNFNLLKDDYDLLNKEFPAPDHETYLHIV